MSEALRLTGFGVRARNRIILQDIDLLVPDRGVVAVLGPGGSGKSTLLRTLTEYVEHSAFEITGEALYNGLPLSLQNRASLVRQKPGSAARSVLASLAAALPNRSELTQLEQRDVLADQIADLGVGWLADQLDDDLFTLPAAHQRVVHILSAALSRPRLVCIDEATAELDEEGADEVLQLIAEIGLRRAVLFVTHNQSHARRVADYATLIAAGHLVEFATTPKFFGNPDDPATRQYVRTGGCMLPSPNVRGDELDEDYRESGEFDRFDRHAVIAQPQGTRELNTAGASSNSQGPRGFRWLHPRRLGGAAYPGIVASTEYDLEALARIGVTHLINLTEEPARYDEAAASVGLQTLFFPVDDMSAPDLDDALELCSHVDEIIEGGGVVIFHCKAGLGRTGTMLAAQLIFEGLGAADALASVRHTHPKWIQSKFQECFLERFARHVSAWRTSQAPPSPPQPN